jgi:DNA-binding CsgD family transcriptional regulator
MKRTATATTLDGIAATSRVMLAPLDYESIGDWQRATNESIKALLGADKVSFLLPLPDGRLEVYSDEFSRATMHNYDTSVLPLADRRWGVRRRRISLGTWNRELLYGRHLRAMYSSVYWNEFLRPLRAFDAIGLTVPAAADGGDVTLYLHHERPRGPRFGDDGFRTLRALHPSFRAGVKSALALMTYRRSLGAVLDAIDVAVVLGNDAGCALHRNAAFGRMLAAASPQDRPHVEAAVLRVLRSSRMPATHEVEIGGARYGMTVSFATAGQLARGDVVLVTVERRAARGPEAAATRGRITLTAREAQVADLLAQGLRNADVAGSLAISTATARHHTEHVMAKLGVHSRAAIAMTLARLRGPA